MTKLSLKGSLVAAIAALGCVAIIPACSSSDQPGSNKEEGRTGSVGLNLITNGVEIDRVEFTVSGPESRSGSINVEDPNATITAFIGNLLAGPGYTIELTAFNNGVELCSGTSMPFAVTAGQTASVGIGLDCGTAATPRGSVVIEGEVVNCPQITSVFVGPLQTSVGSTIDLSAAASSAAAGFAWTGSPGNSFASPTGTSTTYTCTTAGTNLITVTMTQGSCAPESVSTEVNCVGGAAGGAGAGGASAGTAGTPAGAAGTPAGAGGTAAGAGGTAAGAAGTPAGAGGTVAGAGGSVAGAAGSVAGAAGNPNACPDCLTASCPAPQAAVATQCAGTACTALQACFATSGCDEEDPRLCYCGTVPFTDCLSSFVSSLPNGDCKAQIDAALVPAFVPVNIPQLMAPFLLETTNPVGANFQLAICQTRECSGQCN